MWPWTSFSTCSCVIGLSNFYLVILSTSVAAEEFRFTKTPGNFTVLQNTTAVFDWRHTVLDDDHDDDPDTGTTNRANILWTYKGRTKQETVPLMSYSVEGGTHQLKSDKSGRLHYSGRAGSAAIKLDRVTSNDDGFYEVSVTEPGKTSAHINVSHMQTLKLADFWFNIKVESESYNRSVINDGAVFWSILLPTLEVSVPENVHVKVVINDVIPVNMTEVVLSDGDANFPQHPCENTHLCERGIPISEKSKNDKCEIKISLKFIVQNMKDVQVRIPLHFLPGKRNCTLCWVIFALAVLGCLLLFLAIYKMFKKVRKHQNRIERTQAELNKYKEDALLRNTMRATGYRDSASEDSED